MIKDNKIYLKHILDAIKRIEEYIPYSNIDDFQENYLLQDGLIRQLEIIGEASRKLSKDLKNWKKIFRRLMTQNVLESDIKIIKGWWRKWRNKRIHSQQKQS